MPAGTLVSVAVLGVLCPTLMAVPPHCRLGQMMPFMGTSDGLSAKSLVFLSFEFQKPTNVGTRPCPLRTLKPKRGLVGLELLNHASIRLYLLGNGVLGSRDPWSSGQIQVELLSLTWLVGTYHLCGETLCITK